MFSCLGLLAPVLDWGINEKSDFGKSGCPYTSKGVSVPLPTLTVVDSNKHRLGYKRIERSDFRFGDGGTGSEYLSFMRIVFTRNHCQLTLHRIF